MRSRLIPLFLVFSLFQLNIVQAENDPCDHDYVAPTAICDYHTVVALGADGIAEVYAETIDDGSTDNCGIADYLIRRMSQGWCPPGYDDDTYFGPKTAFCCEDVGTTQWVVLKVIDYHGNSAECMGEVTVQANLYPSFECPPNIEISCDFWFSDSDLYNVYSHTFGTIVPAGTPQQPIIINDPGNPSKPQPYNWGRDGVANCGNDCNGGWGGQMPWITVAEVIDMRNSCGVGRIQRKFMIECNGWTDWCYQTITVKDFYGGWGYGITWPKDYTVEDCGANPEDYLPENLPPPYNKPNVGDGGSCSLIGYAYKDLVFTFVEGACAKILREWTVIDWCKYNPDYPWSGGIWKHTQIIKFANHEAPVFHYDCDDVVVEGYESACAGRYQKTYDVTDDCTPEHLLKYDYKIDLYRNGSYEIMHEGTGKPTVDKVLPLGWHKILIYVEDQCGNTTTCSHYLHVVDKKKPTPVCMHGLSSVVMPIGGMVTIWAKDFDVSSYDNCTPRSQLKFSFSDDVTERSRVFNCDDIGVVPVQIWVTDQYNNQQFCSTYIQIDDNEGACIGTNPVSGAVTSYRGVAIPGAEVDLYKIMPDQSLESDDHTSITNALGLYSTGFGTTAYDRQLIVSRIGDEKAGISTLDLVDLQRHILGLETFTQPEQYKAADLDGNGRVGVMDLLLLRNVLLGGITDEMDLGWYFYDETCTWEAPEDILSGTCGDGYTIDQTSTFPMPVNFFAVKMGDINYDMTNTAWHIESRSPTSFDLKLQLDENDNNILHVKAGSDLQSYGAQFSIPMPLSGFDVKNGVWTIDQNTMRVDAQNNLLHFSIAKLESMELVQGATLFSVVLDQPEADIYRALITEDIYSDGLVPEVYTKNKEAIDITFIPIDEVTQTNEQIDTYMVSITPNPVTELSVVEITSPANTEGEIQVFNEVGAQVISQKMTVSKGNNRILIDAHKLSAGMYYYSVQFENFHQSGKLIKL